MSETRLMPVASNVSLNSISILLATFFSKTQYLVVETLVTVFIQNQGKRWAKQLNGILAVSWPRRFYKLR